MVPDAEWSFPPIPPEHKSLAPYFQRAQELRSKDPVMAYWCTFYAVQNGITTKPQNTQFLMQVLNVLEHMKRTLANNAAVVDNSKGASYVEAFALRIFNMADNEDRKGLATRSTAKKFVASTNFFEVLHVFEKPLSTEIIEKIRYAKWKAADLAKAFREGRKPTPGDINAPPPPGEAATLASPPTATSLLDAPPSMSAWSPGTSLAPSPAGHVNQNLEPSPVVNNNVPLPPTIASNSPENATPFSFSSQPHKHVSLNPVANPPSTPSPRALGRHLDLNHDNEPAAPGTWSTVATPGIDDTFDRSDAYRMMGDADELKGSPSARVAAKRQPAIANVNRGGIPTHTNQGDVEGEGDVQDDGWSTTGMMSLSRQGSLSVVDHTSEAPKAPDITNVHTTNELGLHQNDEASLPSLPPLPLSSTPLFVKKVHFSPSVVGGLSSTSSSIAGSSPPGSPERYVPSLPTVQEAGAWDQAPAPTYVGTPALLPEMHLLPDSGSEEGGSSKDVPPVVHKLGSSAGLSSPSGLETQPPILPEPSTIPPRISVGSLAQLSSPPPVFPAEPSIPARSTVLPPPPGLHPTPGHPMVPPDFSRKDHRHLHHHAPQPRTPTPPPDLSSVQISLIQKHCRFAISALDYEDAETARKELRAALAMLGG